MKKILILSLIAFFTGCVSVSSKGYEQLLDTWIGSGEDQLISQWGVPTSSYETNDHKYLKFHKGYGWTQYGEVYCDVTMTLTNGIITTWAFKGNACEAEEEKTNK